MLVFPRYCVECTEKKFTDVNKVEITFSNEYDEEIEGLSEILKLTLYFNDGRILNVDNVVDVEVL